MKIALMCFSTARLLRNSSSAMAWLLLPCAICPRISSSRRVSSSSAERSPLNQLTARELEVLAEIATGKSNSAIADSLVLTKRAVEKHINAIFVKLGLSQNEEVSRRVKAALIYLSEEPPRA